jgi:O-antigen/teichoic acid export membrane protein
VWSFTSKYLTTILAFGSVVVLARLLTPEQIGIYSIAAAFFTIGQHFRDFGIGSYIVQEKDLTKEKLMSAFSLSIGVCWSLGLLFILSSGLISDFYGRDELNDIFFWLELCFFIMPFGALSKAMLKRQMEFKKILVVDVSSAAVHATVGITAAYLGYGYMSLAWASFAGISTSIGILVFLRPASMPWLIGFSEIRNVVSFGWKITTANITGHLMGVAPEIIVGKVFGAPAVAILGKATSSTTMFRQLIFQAIANVAEPVFAENNREGGSTKSPFLFATSCLIAISWPFFSFMALHADGIILFLFGAQWVEAVPFLQIMCVAAMIQAITSFVPTYLVSVGKVGRIAKLQIIFFSFGVSTILLGAMVSLQYVCFAIVADRILRTCCYSWDIFKDLNTSLEEFGRLLIKVSVVTFFSMVAPVIMYLTPYFDSMNIVMSLFISALLSVFCWLIAVHLTKHEIGDELVKVYTVLGIINAK